MTLEAGKYCVIKTKEKNELEIAFLSNGALNKNNTARTVINVELN